MRNKWGHANLQGDTSALSDIQTSQLRSHYCDFRCIGVYGHNFPLSQHKNAAAEIAYEFMKNHPRHQPSVNQDWNGEKLYVQNVYKHELAPSYYYTPSIW